MYRTKTELENGIEYISQSPKNEGKVELIVCRPCKGERKLLESAELDMGKGLIGDSWLSRGTAEKPADPKMQLNLMNSRAISVIAPAKEDWKLAGDQFFVDLDLSPANLPPGTRLEIGDAIIEITEKAHTGCKMFTKRFGRDATAFVNSKFGRSLNLRGVNARILQPGSVNVGSLVKKIQA